MVTASQRPHLGMPQTVILARMLATEIQKAGKKRDSVGCETHLWIVRGNITNRVTIRLVKMTKRITSRTKTISPRTVRPRNLCGVR